MKQKIEVGSLDSQAMVSKMMHPYGCILLRCIDGYARLSINHHLYLLRRGEVCILTSDLFLSVERVSEHFSARYIFLPEEIFNFVYYQVTKMSLWYFLLQNPVLHLTQPQRRAFGCWMDLMEWTVHYIGENLHEEIAGKMACNLFNAIDDQLAASCQYSKQESHNKNAGWNISVKFFTLLYQHYKEQRNIDFFAKKMNISPDYLTKVINSIYGTSPKRLINEQLTEDIKFRLSHTSQTIKEIANKLHFDDSSYFCRFFRKQTGCSPLEYRNSFLNGRIMKHQK